MASGLEFLPFELLQEICYRLEPIPSARLLRFGKDKVVPKTTRNKRLPFADIARLVRTSKSLHFHIDPLLYSAHKNDGRTIALYIGIRKGNVDTIRKAISYGASPDILSIRGPLLWQVLSRYPYEEARSWSVAPLYLALKFKQPLAFEALLEHGADVRYRSLWALPRVGYASWMDRYIGSTGDEDPSLSGVYLGKKFSKRLCKPCNEASLRSLLDRAVPNDTNGEDGKESEDKPLPLQRISLVSVMGWASLDLLEFLLDKKVDPNGLHPGFGHQYMSPLSAAILLRSPEKFKLLISRGADIYGTDVAKEHSHMHIPIFAAVSQMLRGEAGFLMVKLCLDHGANINRPCHEHDIPKSHKEKGNEIPHVCTTALFSFLKSVRSWSWVKPGEIGPLEGLQYLLDAGASAVSPPSKPIQRRHHNRQQSLHDRTYGGASSAVEVLLDKESLRSVSNQPKLFQALKMLIKHGAAQSSHARILVKYDSIEQSGGWICPEDVNTWRKLVDLLMNDMKKRDVNIDAVLRRVITDKGRLRKTIAYSPWRGVGEIGRTSIDALLAAGARINARIKVPFNEATASDRDTALQEVCAAIIHTDELHDDFHDHADGQLCEYSLTNATTYRDWFAFLISRGADPWFNDTHKKHRKDGGSAISIILSPMKEGRARPDGRGSLEKHLMGLFIILRGFSAQLVYQGKRSDRDVLQVLGWLSTSLQRGRNASGEECLAR